MNLAQEKDIERLRQAALLLESENARLVSKVLELTRQLSKAKGTEAAELELRIAELEEQLARRNRMLFAPSSEKQPPGQPAPNVAVKPPKKGHGPKEQPALAIVERVHELDEADRACTSCGGALSTWEGQAETSEEIDVLERKFVLVKHVRQKYRCKCGGCIETALPPQKLFEGARYSIDFAVEVAIQKYLDHMPLERQVRIMRREGLDVESQTLWDYLERMVRLLTPAWERLWAFQLLQAVLNVDETRWPLLGKSPEQSSKWHAWALASAQAIFYRIADSRSAEAARELLKDFKNEVVADGYAVYPALVARGAEFGLSHCWSHVRREFLAACERYPEAEKAIALIARLYEVEREYADGERDIERLRRLRNEKSRSIIDELRSWALEQRALPQSSLGKAIAYMGGRWNGLIRFLDNPLIPLDNNAVERAMRGPVIGRKNHYGSRSRRGTEVAAVFYSLLESAKLNGLEPKAYLRTAIHAALRGEQIPLPHELVSAQPSV